MSSFREETIHIFVFPAPNSLAVVSSCEKMVERMRGSMAEIFSLNAANLLALSALFQDQPTMWQDLSSVL